MNIIIRNTILITFYIILMLFFLNNRSSSLLHAEETSTQVTLYGNEKSSYCRETRRWLEENSIPYTYRDVELYGTYQEEMYRKLSGSGTARLPVLDVKGQMLIRPSVGDIQKALRGERVIRSEERKLKNPLWRPEKKKSLTVKFDSVKAKMSESDLILYVDGSADGGKLAAKIKKEGIPFTLKEMNRLGNAAFFDLSSRLADSGYGNTLYFPIAEVHGEIIMKASLDDIKILVTEVLGE